MLLIDQLAYSNRLSRANPRIKMGLSIALLLTTVSVPLWYVQLAIGIGMAGGVVFVARIPWKVYLKILAWPASFLLISLLSLIISISGQDSAHAMLFWKSFSIGSFRMGLTYHGLSQGAHLFLRSASSITCLLFLSMTTPFDQQIRVMKLLRAPDTLVELYALTYRFIAIFLEEATVMYTAQQMRFGYVDYKTSIHCVAMIIRLLFLNVFRRYKDMEVALEAKLYDGHFYLS